MTQENTIEWNYSIPLFSMYILKGVLTVFLIPVLFLLLILFLSGAFNDISYSNLTPDIYYAGSFVGMIILATFLVLVILYHNGFQTSYKVDAKGAYQISGSRSKKMNRLTTVAGVLGRSPMVTGAGLLAYSGEDRFIPWREAKVINIDQKKKYIFVSRGKIAIGPIGIFCTPDNFKQVLELIKLYSSKN